MCEFTHLNNHDNSNEIDGTPGSPHVQIVGAVYMCSASISTWCAKLARPTKSPHRFIADFKSHANLLARFDKATQNTDYEFIEFARGKTTNTWYARTIAF